MANAQFTLTSKLHEKNICSGLSYLQQNGEFVDMTLAADGHFVKVHQVIIALSSSYIKELISSAQCQHPVIFLNKISHTTLCAILEYIYTGEVLVAVENLNELAEAGKELHIKGLEDINLHTMLVTNSREGGHGIVDDDDRTIIGELYLDTTNSRDGEHLTEYSSVNEDTYKKNRGEEFQDYQEISYEEAMEEDVKSGDMMDEGQLDDEGNHLKKKDLFSHLVNQNLQRIGLANVKVGNPAKHETEGVALQYTVSNQGSLQMILNRYMYYLKYTNRNKTRQWRCVDYLKSVRCPAHVITKDDVVIQRISAHTHPFHDNRILKKLRAGAIFSAIVEAERQGETLLKNRGNGENNQSE